MLGMGTTPNDTALAVTTLVRSSRLRLNRWCSKEQATSLLDTNYGEDLTLHGEPNWWWPLSL